MTYKLRSFSVTERSSGIKGQARFFRGSGTNKIAIRLDDDRCLISHKETIEKDFAVSHYEFIDAKAEKLLADELYSGGKK